MLEVLKIRSPSDKWDLFSSFQPGSAAWIVSDLQSKWQLQNQLLERTGRLEQASVWRASELWRHLAWQIEPDWRVLSAELAQTLVWSWLKPMNLPWASSPRAVPAVMNQLQSWVSVLADPGWTDLVPQWFQSNPDGYVRWGHWFELCAEIWGRFQADGLVMANWLPALLLNRDLSRLVWSREMTFDLGPRITPAEGHLMRELGRHFDARVVFPMAPWAALMRGTLRPYDDLLPKPFAGDPDWRPPVSSALRFARFTTQLAEIKNAIALARGWLESGVRPESIAIVAPDIEPYWPALRLYAEQEGIPVAKPVGARLGSFPEIAKWVATLRVNGSQINGNDLQVMMFGAGSGEPGLTFEEFRVLFTNVYGPKDLSRAGQWFEGRVRPAPTESLTVAEFLGWSLRHWPAGADTERLERTLALLTAEVPGPLRLAAPEWVAYLDGLLARRELTLHPAAAAGVWCVSVSSADWLPATHAVVMNLSEDALRSVERGPVTALDLARFAEDTGYPVGGAERQETEFEFLWFLQRRWQELELTFAATDFQGQALTPSKFWMWPAFANEALHAKPKAPPATRWDEIQRLDLEALGGSRHWAPERYRGVDLALRRDLSATVSSWNPEALPSPPRPERLSASSLERYWQCPFQFAAERKLKLSDAPVLDLDLDRRTRGRLLHALAETLVREPMRYAWTDTELCELVDRCREKENLKIGEEGLWPAIRSAHVKLARQLLEFERQWRERFPETRTLGREMSFACGWDLEENRPTTLDAGGAAVLSGRIDRVDGDSHGAYAVIDYKSSANGLRNWKSWRAHHDVQLALYAVILERGLVGLPAGPVHAANYYVVKDADRRKGLHVRDVETGLYSADDSHRNWISSEEKSALLAELSAEVTNAVRAISEGRLNPAPETERLCADCAWRPTCRAPHLN